MASTSEESAAGSRSKGNDYSEVKPPLQLGTTGLKQLLQCYQLGTDDIRETLMQECDVVIECKVCRSLYRGLPNFFAHKRLYCRSKYSGSLVRFQDLASKEDEFCIFASSYFTSGAEATEKEPDKSPTKSFYDNVEKVGENISRVRSTDKVFNLETLKQNKNAVRQHLTFSGLFNKEPVVVIEQMVHADVSRKRKAEDEIENRKSKAQKLQSEVPVPDNTKTLNGIYPKPTSNKIINLRQFYAHHRLTKDFNNTCLKCKLKFTNYKNLSRHMQRHHFKRNMFHSCKKCSKLFLNSSSYIHHLMNNHTMSVSEAKVCTAKPKVEKFVMDNGHVYNIPNLRKMKSGEEEKTRESNPSVKTGSAKFKQKSQDVSKPQVKPQVKPVVSLSGPASSFETAVTVLRCLGTVFFNITSHKYKCLKHPSVRFGKYDSLKSHVEEKHLRATITCPMCQQTFKRCNGNAFDKLVKHLTVVHKVTKLDVIKAKTTLRNRLLTQVDSSESEKMLQMFQCPQCGKLYESQKNLRYHLISKHGLNKDECSQWTKQTLRYDSPDPEASQSSNQTPAESEQGDAEQPEAICIDDDDTVTVIEDEGSSSSFRKDEKPCVYQVSTSSFSDGLLKTSQRKSLRNYEDGHVASTFNMEDVICLWCPLNFPKFSQLMKHIKNHHSDKWDPEKSDEIRNEITKKQQKHQAQIILNLSASRSRRSLAGMGIGEVPAGGSNTQTEQDDSEETETDWPEVDAKSRRKQASPSKAEGYQVKSTSEENAEGASTVTFKSGFSLHRCPKCAKVFGKEKALKDHEKNCVDLEEDPGELGENAEEPPEKMEEDLEKPKEIAHSKKRRSRFSIGSLSRPRCSVCFKFMKDTDAFDSEGKPVLMHRKCKPKSEKESDSESDDNVENGDSESVATSQTSNDEDQESELDKDESLDSSQGDDDSADEEVKSYTCPVCAKEESKLSTMNTHLMRVHAWKKTKVAYSQNSIRRSCTVKKSVEEPDLPRTEADEVVLIDVDPEDVQPSVSEIVEPKRRMAKSDSPTQLPRYMCFLCPKHYDRLDSLAYHWQVIHKQSEDSIKKLKEKSKEMYKRDQDNVKQKEILFKCLFCQKTFSSLNNLVTHWRTLHKQSTTAITDLKQEAQAGRDKQIQEREFHFKCTLCSKTSPRIDRLVSHWQAVHQQTPSSIDNLKRMAIQARDEELAKAEEEDEG